MLNAKVAELRRGLVDQFTAMNKDQDLAAARYSVLGDVTEYYSFTTAGRKDQKSRARPAAVSEAKV